MADDDTQGGLPEQWARRRIDAMLEASGWVVQDYRAMNVRAARGVVVRELPTAAGPADYVLFVDRQAVGVIDPGDILLNEGGDRDKLGRGWIWEGQIEDCIHQNHVFRARLTSDEFDPKFVSMHANTWGRTWFERHGKQTTNLASINLTVLKQFPVPAPSRLVQRGVVEEMDRIDEHGRRLEQSVNASTTRIGVLRRSVLAAAFAGRLVPQDPDDEPAAVLLERIRAERAAATPTKRRTPKGAST